MTSILLFPIAVILWAVTGPFDRRRLRYADSPVSGLRCTPGSTLPGRWRSPGGSTGAHKTYMLVANHLSLLDIPVLFRLFKDSEWCPGGDLQGSGHRLEHATESLYPVAAWRPGERHGDDDLLPDAPGPGILGDDVPGGHSIKTGSCGTSRPAHSSWPERHGFRWCPSSSEVPPTRPAEARFRVAGRHRISVTVLPAVDGRWSRVSAPMS